MLDRDQGRELAAAGAEICGPRPSRTAQLDDRLHDETGCCRDIVADELGSARVSFAYPYGCSSRRVDRPELRQGPCPHQGVRRSAPHTPSRRG
ncbi:hypothetical protein [Streptomyces sp.]|uniref:hypothetical protein n=1 Tax=Streptomyces sp. TaxID=1931 RepID=UPI0039C94C11